MTAQVAADLRAAADVLRRDGWTQGALHSQPDCGGSHCVRGALHVATGVVASYEQDETEAADAYMRSAAAERALAREIGLHNASWIPGWNDEDAESADEVIAALEAAADAAEAEQ